MSLGEMAVTALLFIGGALIGKLLSLVTGIEDGMALYAAGILTTILLFYLGARVVTCFMYPDEDDWLYIFLRNFWTFVKNCFAGRLLLARLAERGRAGLASFGLTEGLLVFGIVFVGGLIGKLLMLLTRTEDFMPLFAAGVVIAGLLFFLVARVVVCFTERDENDTLYVIIKGIGRTVKNFFRSENFLTRREQAGRYLDFWYDEGK